MIKTKQLGKSAVGYDTITGKFYWITCCRKPWMIDQEATYEMPNGYLYIKADGKSHSASRLAWELYNEQTIPKGLEIDHMNRNRQDNRPENLRITNGAGNLANSIRPLGRSGYRGIRIYNRPSGNGHLWRVNILGTIRYYATLSEAIAGYAKLASEACDRS